jgi:hypothetical protein
VRKNALASVPLGHGEVTGLDKFGYPDVKSGISDGPRFLKCTAPCLLDGSKDIWGRGRDKPAPRYPEDMKFFEKPTKSVRTRLFVGPGAGIGHGIPGPYSRHQTKVAGLFIRQPILASVKRLVLL